MYILGNVQTDRIFFWQAKQTERIIIIGKRQGQKKAEKTGWPTVRTLHKPKPTQGHNKCTMVTYSCACSAASEGRSVRTSPTPGFQISNHTFTGKGTNKSL